jgi:hypothetical protein
MADDDWLLPPFCSSALGTFEEFPAAQFVIGHTLNTSGGIEDPINVPRFQPGFYSQPDGMLTLLKNRFPPEWIGILFRTEALQDIGSYVTEADGIDFGFLLRASHLEFAVFSRDVAVFREHPGSISCGGNFSLKMVWPCQRDAVQTLLESPTTPRATAAVLAPLLQVRISKLIYAVGRRALRIHDYEEAKSAASILRIDFRKRARGSLLRAFAILMQRSALVERIIDVAHRCRTRCASLVRPLADVNSSAVGAQDNGH